LVSGCTSAGYVKVRLSLLWDVPSAVARQLDFLTTRYKGAALGLWESDERVWRWRRACEAREQEVIGKFHVERGRRTREERRVPSVSIL
jgi:hypothetical protein